MPSSSSWTRPSRAREARLTVAVHNPTDLPGGPISLALPLDWLHGYRLDAADPMPVDGTLDGTRADNALAPHV